MPAVDSLNQAYRESCAGLAFSGPRHHGRASGGVDCRIRRTGQKGSIRSVHYRSMVDILLDGAERISVPTHFVDISPGDTDQTLSSLPPLHAQRMPCPATGTGS